MNYSKLLYSALFFVASLKTQAALFFSQNNAGQSFMDLTNWNTVANGSGANPILADLTNGTNIFLVQNGHTVKIDGNIIIDRLIVGQGTATTVLVEGSAVRSITMVSGIYVDANGVFQPENTTLTHNIQITGAVADITNLGTLNPRLDNNTLVDLVYSGTGTMNVAGNVAINFAGLSANNGGTINSSGTIRVYGDLNFSLGSDLIGVANIEARRNVIIGVGSSINLTNGTFSLNEIIDQNFTNSGDCQFFNLTLDNGPGVPGVKTFVGKISVENNFTVVTDAIFAGASEVVIQANLTIQETIGWTGSGLLRFARPIPTYGTLNLNGRTTVLGTADVQVDGYLQVSDNNSSAQIVGDLTLSNNARLLLNPSTFFDQVNFGTKTLTLGANSYLYARGVTNFPASFGTYNLDITSQVRYDGPAATVFFQQVKGNIQYGILHLQNNTKASFDGDIFVNGQLFINGGTNFTLTGFDLHIKGDVAGSGGVLECSNSVYLDGVDKNQTLDPDVTYIFQNLYIQNVAPTAIRTKNIDNNILVMGILDIQNTGGNASNYLIVDIDNNTFNGQDFGGTLPAVSFNLGANVDLRTSGANGFQNMVDGVIPNFPIVTINNNSTVRFDANAGTQNIPGGISFGNVSFAGDGNKSLQGDVTINGSVDGNVNNYVFSDNGHTITLYGNWVMGEFGGGFARTNMTGNFIFAGGNQNSSESDFNNVQFAGTGTKTMNFHIDVACGIEIISGVTLTSNYDIEIGCNLTVLGTGRYIQNDFTTTFDGTANQTITIAAPTTSYFNNFSITNTTGIIQALSNLDVDGNLTMNNGGNAQLDITNMTLRVEKDFLMYTEDRITTTGSTIIFDGAADQVWRNGYALQTYNNIEFRNGGEKRLATNAVDINGNVTGDAAATLNQNGINMSVAGNYIHPGSISGAVGNIIFFDGANQNIGAAQLNTVRFAGTATKTLVANTYIKGALFIDPNSTLSAGTGNFQITLDGDWNNDNGGIFDSRSGRVVFSGGNSNIFTGGDGPNKDFNFVQILLATTSNTKFIADRAVNLLDAGIGFKTASLQLSRGVFVTNASDVTIRFSLSVSTLGTYNCNNNTSILSFGDGVSVGLNLFWTPGINDIYRSVQLNSPTSRLSIFGSLGITGSNNITVISGTFDMNGRNVTFLSTNSDLIINGTTSTFEVDAGAVLAMGTNTNCEILNNNGNFRVVGTVTIAATISSSSSFSYIQTGASSRIFAQYYNISGTRLNGFDIQDGTVDATNNFSNGTFGGGFGTSYLKIHNSGFLAPATIRSIIFNESSNNVPTRNISHTGGSIVTLENSSGTMATPNREDDDLSASTGFVRWVYPGGFFWTGLGGNSNWDTPANWFGNVVPVSTSQVFLDHTYLAGAYTVNVNTAVSAFQSIAGGLSILNSPASGKITLNINGKPLNVNGNLTIGNGQEIRQFNPSDTLFISGSYANTSGILNGPTGVVVFEADSGSYTISTNSSTNANTDFNNVLITGGAKYTLTDIAEVEGNLTMTGGTLSLGDPNNALELKGNWTISDSAKFEHLEGDVFVEGTAGTQLLDLGGQKVFSIFFRDAALKEFVSGAIIEEDFFIQATSGNINGRDNLIIVERDWRNAKDINVFTQNGNGSVIMNGNFGQFISRVGDQPTRFNNLILQNAGNKTVHQNIEISGNLIVQNANIGVVFDLNTTAQITAINPSSRLLMTQGTMWIRGNNFPAGFNSYELNGGEVRYYSNNTNQNIYPTTYYRLRLDEVNGAASTTKTALGDIIVEENFYITDNRLTLNMDCHTITLNGGLDFAAGAKPIDWGAACMTTCGTGGTMIIGEGVGGLDADLRNFHNLIVDNNGLVELRLNSNITIEGNFQVLDNSRFDMAGRTITNSCAILPNNTTFSLNNSTVFQTAVNAPLVSLPSGFGNYSFSPSSSVQYQGVNQTVYTNNGTITYGNLLLEGGGNKTLDGNLFVDGNYDMNTTATTLITDNFNMELNGSVVEFERLTVGNSIVTFGGNDQTIRLANTNTITFNETRFTGTGTKLFWDDETYNFNGDFKVGEDVTIDMVTWDQDVYFRGDSILIEGIFKKDNGNNRLSLEKSGVQVVDFGPANELSNLEITGNSQTTFINNGININQAGGIYNYFLVSLGSSADLDTMTHKIGQANFTINGSLSSSDANLVFNSNGNQLIDGFEAQNVLLTGGGRKNMNGIWRLNDLTIDPSVTYDMNFIDTVVVRGNWISNGAYDREDATVVFEIDDNNPRFLTSNGNSFARILTKKIGSSIGEIFCNDDLYVDDSLSLGNGTFFNLNGNDFNLGFPYDGGTEYEKVTIQTDARLTLDNGSNLLFDGSGAVGPVINNYGTFSMVGTASQNSNVLRAAGASRIDINILGGLIKAQNYSFSDLSNDGIEISANAIIDPVNNFSDGTFSNMAATTAYYLKIESDVTGLSPIKNITFNHTAPVVGTNFNVQRNRLDGGVLTFQETVSGNLGSFQYEKEVATAGVGDRIIWPTLVVTNWIGGNGAGPNDWFIAANWDNGVPDTSKTATIGVRAFQPIIATGGADTAKCKKLILRDNNTSLTLRDGIDLFVKNDIIMGNGTALTKISVQNSGSHVIVGGSWTKNVNSIFENGLGTVKFLALSGTVNLSHNDPDETDAFHNIVFDGPSSFNIIGDLNINGNVSQLNGAVNPKTNNYTIFLAGDWLGTGGSFSTSINGTVVLDGANQELTNTEFDRLTVSGTSCKTVTGPMLVNDFLIVNSCLEASPTGAIDMNNDVTINLGGSFNDGGQIHTFSGANWLDNGIGMVNTGKISFDRTGGTQNIFNATFNSLEFIGTSAIVLQNNIQVRDDLTINNTINTFNAQTFSLINPSGTGSMFLGDNETYFANGLNSYPTGFSSYTVSATSTANFSGTGPQNLPANAQFGNLILNNISTKTLQGNIQINGNLTINFATLDVSPSNYSIGIKGAWNNNNQGSFESRQGTVTFNGSGAQGVSAGDHLIDGNKAFYNVVVNNTAPLTTQRVDLNAGDIYINGSLDVIDGVFTLEGIGAGWNAHIGKSLTASGGGSFTNTGTYFLTNTANEVLSFSTNSSTLLNVVINSTAGTIYNMTNDVKIDGNFDLLGGVFNLNGNRAELGTDINDQVVISGSMNLNAGSELLLGNQTSLLVDVGGSFRVVGTSASPAYVGARYTNTDYNFTVNGSIAAQDYIFESMSNSGIFVTALATIDNVNNFSNGTFANPRNSGLCLRIENNQRFTTANGNRIENVKFPNNPGVGTRNVAKINAIADSVEFYNATGALSGENFENDPNTLIFWTGPRKMVWTGAKNTDWFDVLNWRATSGPTQVPDTTLDVLIPFVVNMPKITMEGAGAKNMVVEQGAFVTLATSTDMLPDLIVQEEFYFEGLITSTSVNDKIEVRGGWSKVGAGNYTYVSGGKVVLAPTAGTSLLNNGNAPFYDLEIFAPGGTVFLATNTRVANNLTVTDGTLDVSSSNYDLTIGNNFINTGSFNPRQGEVEFTGNMNFGLDATNTNFFDITKSGSGTMTLSSNAQVNGTFEISNGIVDVSSNTLNMGDGVGSDQLKLSGGTLNVTAGSTLSMGNNSSISVNSGGTFNLLGTDLSSRAILEGQGTAIYSVNVGFGGNINAKFYNISDLNILGINLLSGSILNLTNNFSYGTFLNGTPGGSFITFNNSQVFTGSDQIEYVEFASNPGGGATNVKKGINSGQVDFYYAIGPFQGEDYESDPFNLINWDADLIWTGAVNSDWNNSNNWNSNLIIPIAGLIPTIHTDVIIPDQITTPNDPILNVNGVANDLQILVNGLFTMANNFDIAVEDSVIIDGTVTINNGSNSKISLGGNWLSNVGTFNSGNVSTVEFVDDEGIQYVNSDDGFCNLVVNRPSPSNAVLATSSSLDINCDLTIQRGVLSVDDVTHTIFLSGNWINNRTTTELGFVSNNGTVVFDGNTTKTITHAAGRERFNNVRIEKTGGAQVVLNSNLRLLNDLTIEDQGILNASSRTVEVLGDWVNNNVLSSTGFIKGTSTVLFSGTTLQQVSQLGGLESFNNLQLTNNIAGTALQLNNSIEISGTFQQIDGIVSTGPNYLAMLSTTATNYSGWGSTNFINGNLRRHVSSIGSYDFPVAFGTSTTDYQRILVSNNNLVGTSYITGSVGRITEIGNNVDSRVDEIEGDDAGSGGLYKAVLGEVAAWSLIPNAQPTSGSYGTDIYLTNVPGLASLDDKFGILKRPDGSTDYADWGDGYPTTAIPADGAVGRVASSGIARRTGWTSFSVFSIGISDFPLPITLLSFNAAMNENKVDLKWVTAKEINNDYFTLEKSTDGQRWVELERIYSKGNSFNTLEYHYVDMNPFAEVTYYRLKQTDLDGKFEYSRIISVSKDLIIRDPVIFPNPTQGDKILLDISDINEVSSIKVIDILGKELTQFKSYFDKDNNLLEFTFYPELETGQFFMNIEYKNGDYKVLRFSAH